MGYKVEVSHVIKEFKRFRALDDITISFEKGKIHGLVGRNGSGKTVLMKCICGLLRVSAGKICIDGKEVFPEKYPTDSIGIIIEQPGYIENYNVYQNLYFLTGLKKKPDKQHLMDVIRKVGLDPLEKKPMKKYSMGMKQRFALAQAIVEDPELMILDEPMNGLDNKGVEEIRTLLLQEKAKGKTIILSSHNKEDIRVLCDTFTELDQGKTVKNSSYTS
ncbi:MAG TPA: ATP-binding cassette domain-containing protein [Firmicutes bacterium]|nr:ATP-binding cassette domain-containing protein [Bacillota bacterium]